MKSSNNDWKNLFSKKAPLNQNPAPKLTISTDQQFSIPYKKDEVIDGKFKIKEILGMGGFGLVYLVSYGHEILALKTFRDEYLTDVQARDRFRKEAQIWVDLDQHPYIVRAFWVDEISRRLYIGMEYISPNSSGYNSLEAFLKYKPPNLSQSLRWAIQICYGMEYAYSKGIRAHRDLKPANILIDQNLAAKITDFGLSSLLGEIAKKNDFTTNFQQGRIGLSMQTVEGSSFGTPTHMAPEQFSDATSCDEKSDIYSFGVILYQMATKGQLPFLCPLPRDNSKEAQVAFWNSMKELHCNGLLPNLDSPIFHIILHCMEKDSKKRFQSFKDIRLQLTEILRHETGEVFKPQEPKKLSSLDWCRKGYSLGTFGRFEEAIKCYNKSIELNPLYEYAWREKGFCLNQLSRYEEAIQCLDRAVKLDPQDCYAWSSKADNFRDQKKYGEAINYYNKALEINPRLASVFVSKSSILKATGHLEESLQCLELASDADPHLSYVWFQQGRTLAELGRDAEAVKSFTKALNIDPYFSIVWYLKASSEEKITRTQDAVASYKKFIELASSNMSDLTVIANQRINQLSNK